MKMPQRMPVDPGVYDREYFLTECEGYDSYEATGGRQLPRRLAVALSLAGSLVGRRVLDMGCGRGELARRCSESASLAAGVDYSPAALELASRIWPTHHGSLLRADVCALPFGDASFDAVFALDLVEHLLPAQLQAMLAEAHRVLAVGGELIVHTMPNLWYYRYGYPLYRLVQRLRGQRLPRDPRKRWRYVTHVHVNEQSGPMLAGALRQAGFQARVMYRNAQTFEQEPQRALRWLYRFLATAWPLAWVFCSDLYAVGRKVSDA